jgi:hypothetical protein
MALKALTVICAAGALFAGPALAHHSFAMFDAKKTNTLTGTVKEFEWINPHAWLHLIAAGPDGKPVTWSFEAGGPGQLTVVGWKPDTLKPGDKISLGYHPLKDGSYGGQLLTVTLSDGKTLCQGGDCRRAAGVTGPGD